MTDMRVLRTMLISGKHWGQKPPLHKDPLHSFFPINAPPTNVPTLAHARTLTLPSRYNPPPAFPAHVPSLDRRSLSTASRGNPNLIATVLVIS